MDYNIYIKLTNGCNLKCKHCYNEIMNNHNSMSDDTLEKVITWLKEFKKANPNDKIDISLHGGEPLLYDLNKILLLLDKTKDLNLRWCITTNLIYNITDTHLKLFHKMKPFDNNSMIMTSYDFGDLRFSNDNERNLWINNVKLLHKENIEVQPIICLTDYVIKNINPQEIFDFFNNLNIKRFNIERITETGRATINKVKPSNKDQDLYLFELYKLYEKNTDIIIPLFEGVENSIKGIFLGCRARECMKRVITINPNGTIASCPNMANNIYGNLNQINVDLKNKLINFEKQIPASCLICKYFTYCNADCCQLKFDETGCPGMKSIYEYLK